MDFLVYIGNAKGLHEKHLRIDMERRRRNRYIGLDVHKKLSYYSMVDSPGTEVR